MKAVLSDSRRRLLIDAATALAAFLLLVVPLVLLEVPNPVAAIGWSILMVTSLAFRRDNPLLAVAICAAAGTGMVFQLPSPTPAVFVVLVICYSAARHLRSTASAVVLPIGIVASFAGPFSWLANIPQEQRFIAVGLLITICLALIGSAYLLGRHVAERGRLAELEQALAEERFLAGSRNTQQASELAEGRARTEVARELHDVVAHSLSVIVVQAEGAKALAAKKPEAAMEALDVIARTGRSSISEMRRIAAAGRVRCLLWTHPVAPPNPGDGCQGRGPHHVGDAGGAATGSRFPGAHGVPGDAGVGDELPETCRPDRPGQRNSHHRHRGH